MPRLRQNGATAWLLPSSARPHAATSQRRRAAPPLPGCHVSHSSSTTNWLAGCCVLGPCLGSWRWVFAAVVSAKQQQAPAGCHRCGACAPPGNGGTRCAAPSTPAATASPVDLGTHSITLCARATPRFSGATGSTPHSSQGPSHPDSSAPPAHITPPALSPSPPLQAVCGARRRGAAAHALPPAPPAAHIWLHQRQPQVRRTHARLRLVAS